MTDPNYKGGLFSNQAYRPLADSLRPNLLRDVVGQDHLLGSDGLIGQMAKNNRLISMILWGPPGCGKTTIARLLSSICDYEFVSLSAVFSGVSELRKIFDQASKLHQDGKGTLLFIDEIHRFNKAQQDGFLPYVENGVVTLVGATTENPSFELNAALLSRCQVLVLHRISDNGLEKLLQRAEDSQKRKLPIDNEARKLMRDMSDGDGRYLLNIAEELFSLPNIDDLDSAGLLEKIQKKAPVYDKRGDSHFNLISALHKSIRGSDVDASLYWLARMLVGGEDPNFISRRLTRAAIEDVGLADPNALLQAIAAWQAYERIGSPEGELALVQCVIYLSNAPKSNSVYKAYNNALLDANELGSLSPPKHVLNAPTKLMQDIGYGVGYSYDHDTEESFSGQNYFPVGMARGKYYFPADRGFESEVIKRLERWEKIRREGQDDISKEQI
ncbi:MAG: Replication-associated recombination protein A [Alphaproteobacteria bacterium MarineAlpha12_Bin1]|jgi:putative ATPase|nr:MAG: Replication-associated recombination protein A [Alphaproteobacteria bacterium MarineAlpha12_Bin1]|tara:strand:- start:3174 stop:4502 length:1329 start_codon:yes stop_codon:yes gene_type:complete